VLVLLAHTASVWLMTGVVWLVQLSVYPGFRLVGRTDAWPEHLALHTKRISWLVPLPWAVQGATTLWLLLDRPDRVPLWLLLVAAALAAATVVTTVVLVLPPLARLAADYDDASLSALLRGNAWRVVAWTGGAACAVAMTALHAGA
jgi:hypothetical protein